MDPNDSHRRDSSIYSPSHRNSFSPPTSMANSTRYMLAENTPPLEPPSLPFSNSGGQKSPSLRSMASKDGALSLSVNYLPSKFSRPHSPGMHKRKNATGKAGVGDPFPKRGGGREAFRAGEARMPAEGDEDYDGVSSGWFGGKDRSKKMRWNKFKWILFVANIFLTVYATVALIFCLLTWFNVWVHADVVRVGNRTELIFSTTAAALGMVTSMIGWSGVLLNNRSFLAIYAFMLWITLAFLVTPGYLTYKRRTFNLEGKVNAQWSRSLGVTGRLRIQNQLHCCGYFSPFIEATVSQDCYARSMLPGCKGDYIRFQKVVLQRWFIVVFSLVPLHLGIIISAMLCSNHITFRFGKGMMPKRYRLSLGSMAVIMDNYASQLAEQYGTDVATDILARSRSNLNLDQMPSMPYTSGTPPKYGHAGGYGSLSS